MTISYAMVWARTGAGTDQFTNCGVSASQCSFDGQVLVRRVDSMHVAIAVRSVSASSDQDATGQLFLVTAMKPFPPLLSRSLSFGHVEYGGAWVYITNPERDDPPILIGEPKPEVARRAPFGSAVHFGALRGVSRYWGMRQLTFDQIRRLQPTSSCDEPGECFAVDGQTWRFP